MEEFTEFYVGENGRTRVGCRADEDGLTMWKGKHLSREAEARISWEDARFWVNAYMEDDVYLLPGEAAENIDAKGLYQQLDLFTMFSEQIDVILRSSGGRENSRKRIYAKYRQGKTPGEIAEFLKKEYGTTGKGFEFTADENPEGVRLHDGKQIAMVTERSKGVFL